MTTTDDRDVTGGVPRRALLPLLPMAGHTAGRRSPVTCHLRCGDACAQPVPNVSGNEYFRDVASAALSRRAVLAGGLVAGAAVVVGSVVADAPPAAAHDRGWGLRRGGLPFRPIAPVPAATDAVTVPAGYRWAPLVRWGDPLLSHRDAFDPATMTPDVAERLFGYNCDYVDLLEDPSGRTAVLVANHEYTNEGIMFPPAATPEELDRQRRVAMAAHGMSVVALHRRRAGRPWQHQVGARVNRRVTATTPCTFDGPAAGSALLRTVADPAGTTPLGTLNNCAGGTTPWGTVLSGEENVNQYFRARGTAEEKRYGFADKETARGWEHVDPRFDARTPGYENEVNRFGWVVELDPQDPTAPPVKHTALGRFKHEGANVIVGRSGHVAAYMGDDERFDYVYKFVSTERYRPGARHRARNKQLLAAGSLYVARFHGDSPVAEITGTGALPSDGAFDGTGEWLPLVVDGTSQVPGFSTEQVLVHTRLAADTVGATKMDRPEDVEPNPVTGRVYVACTNNTDRGAAGKEGPTEPNPRTQNRHGHVVEITEAGDDVRATTFGWSILLLAGDPATTSGTYFAGFPPEKVSPISCPDNVAFDSEGTLWISTDGQPGTIGYGDGLFKVPLTGRERGRVQQFLSVPTGAETCGPVVRDRDGMVYVAVQHPGEDGVWGAQQSFFPDYVAPGALEGGRWGGPRPSVVQVWRD
ncbi:PhoX family protein [Cellulomonas shaoxiangyii]|uniref:PhoX family phosphatase n=1 Tax=Cellulomonas shaoxiangyii TaxID=2566013 RepID=A0A4V1CN18_9CELL|nr:PhoX family phosphatase [Cellulomonas shaoxiangyii]QCB94895.1 PhoX family phosphatase [Cellulomonas shaoxiangyii]TGY85124.1 PhoX family phosphatase [Cellulomonas shaoxiangyii]